MLQYGSVYPTTLELLKELMSLKDLNDFFLVGGTALSLHLGHRISIDLDLFSLKDFNTKDILSILNHHFEVFDFIEKSNTLNIKIAYPKDKDAVKVDFIKYDYPLLNPIQLIDGVRILSVEDIIPMKLSAIGSRGSKKDFYDFHYLLKNYTINEMFGLFKAKYPKTNLLHFYKSLTYFEDADTEANPITIIHSDWVDVKNEIKEKVNLFLIQGGW